MEFGERSQYSGDVTSGDDQGEPQRLDSLHWPCPSLYGEEMGFTGLSGPPTEPGFSQGFFFRSVTILMEFWFLAVVASGLLSWGNFISSNITELIAQILFKLNWAGRWQSPDLNPIEHLWDVVEREIRIMDVQPTNLLQLRDAIMSIWTKISEECFQHLVESMPRRIKAVLKAKGGPTNPVLARCT